MPKNAKVMACAMERTKVAMERVGECRDGKKDNEERVASWSEKWMLDGKRSLNKELDGSKQMDEDEFAWTQIQRSINTNEK